MADRARLAAPATASTNATVYAEHVERSRAARYARRPAPAAEHAYAGRSSSPPPLERGPSARGGYARRAPRRRVAGFDAFTIARYAAPVVFLVAVVAVVVIISSSA